jgi:hypothetical protein
MRELKKSFMLAYYLLMYFVPIVIMGELIKQKNDLLKSINPDYTEDTKPMIVVLFMWPLFPLFFWIYDRYEDNK